MGDVIFSTPLKQDTRTFSEWRDIFIRRQEERRVSRSSTEHVAISIQTDKPILLVPFGDIHAGGEDVDYERFAKELSWVAGTPNVYALTLGDLTDSFFWGKEAQDEQLGAFVEQNKFLRAGLQLLAENKKLLASWRGDHDGWVAAMGETIYAEYAHHFHAQYLEGLSYVSLTVGTQVYKISGAHRHMGFSLYNNAHTPIRAYRDAGEGSDIVITAHTHMKGYLAQPVKRFGGFEDIVHFLSIGPYKRSDTYARKKGFHVKGDGAIGPQSILLNPKTKHIQVFEDVQSGLEAIAK